MSTKSLPLRWLLTVSLFAVLMGAFFTACKKQEISIPPAQVEFGTNTGGAAYFVQDDPQSVFHIPVGVTSTSKQSRNITYKVTYTSGAEGQQYTFGGTKGTATIPADSTLGYIDIKGIYAGFSSSPGRVDTIILTLTGGDLPLATFNQTYTLTLQQYCPVVLADLLGQYDNCYDFYGGGAYGPYSVTITGSSTGATSAKLVVVPFVDAVIGPYAPTDPGYNGTTLNIDWADPANFKVNIPSQGIFVHPTYGLAKIAGGGTFSSCFETFDVTYSVSVSAGTFSGFEGTLLQR